MQEVEVSLSVVLQLAVNRGHHKMLPGPKLAKARN